MKPQVLFIAGLDPSGNAGLARDLEMASLTGVHAAAVATALTAQGKSEFFAAQAVGPAVFRRQLASVGPISAFGAVKIGMLGNEKIVKALARALKACPKPPPVVLDPVCESTSGGALLTVKGRKLLWEALLPLVTVWTPNLPEASWFLGEPVRRRADMERAAVRLFEQTGVPILLKGGHCRGEQAADFFFDGSGGRWLVSRRLPGLKTRGTGCALSSLLACCLALGKPLRRAVPLARRMQGRWLLGKEER